MRQGYMLRMRPSALCPTSSVRYFANHSRLLRPFREGDVVILRGKKDGSQDGTLIRLDALKATSTHRGSIYHSDIIGKEPRQLVQSTKGSSFRIYEPTLAEYVRLTPRLVTPIYPSDTNLIVSLLDIHVDTFSDAGTAPPPPLEILEAGTGHGALTLHLSRAIHAANPPYPSITSHATTQDENDPEYDVCFGESVADLQESARETWKANRRAIVHTLDISAHYSKHANKIVKGFRDGIYARNVDFHVGDISAWVQSQRQLRKTEEPFLTHVLLDLPNANAHLANVAPALHVDGMLGVFNPSITQIAECVEMIRELKLPYLLDQVVELGASTIREWDVRAVRPRATLTESGATDLSKASSEESTAPAQEQATQDAEPSEHLAMQQEKWAMVCRPKAGQQVVGGGFLGLWRRMGQAASQSQEAEKSQSD